MSDRRAIAAKVADDMLAQARGFSDAGILKPKLVRQAEEHLSEKLGLSRDDVYIVSIQTIQVAEKLEPSARTSVCPLTQ